MVWVEGHATGFCLKRIFRGRFENYRFSKVGEQLSPLILVPGFDGCICVPVSARVEWRKGVKDSARKTRCTLKKANNLWIVCTVWTEVKQKCDFFRWMKRTLNLYGRSVGKKWGKKSECFMILPMMKKTGCVRLSFPNHAKGALVLVFLLEKSCNSHAFLFESLGFFFFQIWICFDEKEISKFGKDHMCWYIFKQ